MDKILVIDDDRIERRMIHRALERLGYSCIESSNGKHAWETLCENEEILLVITDMKMPDMDGKELLALMRSRAEFVDLPVIIVSGTLSREEVEATRAANPDATFFFPKPIDLAAIKALVISLMSFGSTGAGARAD
jgi:CheY-like chemotaxis protein